MSINARFLRQLPIIGVEGQEKLRRSHVTIVGLGGLGSTVSILLAAAGVGTLTIIDGDRVEPSNLNRQILYDEASIGLPKAVMAAHRLSAFNSLIKINYINDYINNNNINNYIRNTDLIIDALDSWNTRLILDKIACKKNIPIIHGAVDGLYGQVLITRPEKNICLKCIAPPTETTNPPPSIGAAVSIVASLQAHAAISMLAGKNWVEPATLYYIELDPPTIHKIKLKPCSRDP